MTITLETDTDRSYEHRVVERLRTTDTAPMYYVQLPPFSAVDYLRLDQNLRIVDFFEVKTRKESAEQIRTYGGLLLKQRKLEELQSISLMTRVPVRVMFAFNNAEGSILTADVSQIQFKEAIFTGRRDRGLATDEEPVVLLNWPDQDDADLQVVFA